MASEEGLRDLEDRPGFFKPNTDQQDRIKKNQENVNRRVLMEYIRVLNLPTREKISLKDQVKLFLDDVLHYNNPLDPYPLSWPKSTGYDGKVCNFRVKMSSAFWSHFTTEGKTKLLEYNKRNKAKVRVVRDQTLALSDIENLSLYLRKKLHKLFNNNQMMVSDITVKNGYITIHSAVKKENFHYRATELAVLLGLDYSDWSGTAIIELLTTTEKRNMEEGRLRWKSLNLLDVFKLRNGMTQDTGREVIMVENSRNRKRKVRDEDTAERKLPTDSQHAEETSTK